MQATYNSWLVSLSIVVAMVVSYTALKLAARVADAEGSGGKLWLLGGAIAMGTGIWSMHFIGMLAFSVPIPLRYGVFRTVGSLVIAIITSGFALGLASRAELSLRRLAYGALVMGMGISAMHYSGMAAITIVPMITYEPRLVAASIGIAVVASFAALWLAFNLRRGESMHIALARAGAAIIMGLAITGMHYTAMAASKLAVGSYCLGGASFDNGWLALTIGLVALGVLGLTLITAIYDAHLTSRSRKDAMRLERVNAALQHGKNLLALATHAAGISSWELDFAAQKTLWTENDIESLRVGGIDTKRSPNAVLEMTHPEDASVMAEAVRKALNEGKDICTYLFRVVTPAGTIVHLEAHARIFCNERGEPQRILGVTWDITEQLLQEERRRELQQQLRDASHEAGMAEVATGVLHSVGNVLNSLSVSASQVQTRLRASRVGNVQRLAALLVEQGDNIGTFLTNDPRGRQTLDYLAQLAQHLRDENDGLQAETQAIISHVGHIRTIVAAQQTYARRGGVVEPVDVAGLMDNAVAIHFAMSTDVTVKREYAPTPFPMLDRHKLLQILSNLVSNARHALREQQKGQRTLTLRIRDDVSERLVIEVEDSGVGIAPEALSRLFEFGFTTKKEGHGFGLHSSAILAQELGGDLKGYSEGVARGARFVLRLPFTVASAVERRSA